MSTRWFAPPRMPWVASRPARRTFPPAIIARLNRAANEALHSQSMKDALTRLSAQPRGGTPEDLAKHMKSEHDKWAPIVAKLGLKED